MIDRTVLQALARPTVTFPAAGKSAKALDDVNDDVFSDDSVEFIVGARVSFLPPTRRPPVIPPVFFPSPSFASDRGDHHDAAQDSANRPGITNTVSTAAHSLAFTNLLFIAGAWGSSAVPPHAK